MALPAPSKLIQASQVIRCVMSSTSLLGSSTIAYMILNSPRGLKSPYSRIIFGMSIADIMQSQGFLLSPFVNVAEDAIWNVKGGNEKVCEAVGSFVTIGSIAQPLYTFFLIYYFLQRVMYKIKPTDFCKQKREVWIHILIWLYPFVFTCYALAKKQINSSRYGSICMIVPKPFGCWLDDSCERGEGAVMTLLLSTNIPLILVFLGILWLLTVLTIYVYKQERLFAPISKRLLSKNSKKLSNASSTIRRVSKSIILANEENDANKEEKADQEKEVSNSQPDSVLMSDIHFAISPIAEEEEECKEEVAEEEAEHTQQPMYAVIATNSNRSSANQLEKVVSNNTAEQQEDLKKHQFLVTKQSFHQSGLYILVFFLTYFCLVLDISRSFFKLPAWKGTFLVNSLFVPSIGLFNIFIYTRPKVMLMKKKYPQLCWIERFLSVIYSGGEIPIAMDDPELSKPSSSSHYAKIMDDSRMISSYTQNGNLIPRGVPQDSQGLFESGRFNLSSLEDNSGEEDDHGDLTGVTFPIGF